MHNALLSARSLAPAQAREARVALTEAEENPFGGGVRPATDPMVSRPGL